MRRIGYREFSVRLGLGPGDDIPEAWRGFQRFNVEDFGRNTALPGCWATVSWHHTEAAAVYYARHFCDPPARVKDVLTGRIRWQWGRGRRTVDYRPYRVNCWRNRFDVTSAPTEGWKKRAQNGLKTGSKRGGLEG